MFSPDRPGPSKILDAQTFGELARTVVDRLSRSLAETDQHPLTCHTVPAHVLKPLRETAAPLDPTEPQEVVSAALDLMLQHSLFVGHPRFLGYVCPAADPMGILADTIVATVNPNAASAMMTPIGCELEHTVIRWLAQLLGLPENADGILLSGGNEANLVGILAAREHRAPWPIRMAGFNHPDAAPLYVYATQEIHNGLQKAVEIAGLGRNALRIVATDSDLRMDVRALRKAIRADRAAGAMPICVAASIGTVATGAIDPLPEIVEVAADEGLWVHVDGSYGAAAAILDDAPPQCRAIANVDSISWDPHKWLRVPYEAGCILLRDPNALTRVFKVEPDYYHLGEYGSISHYYEKGPQNSRNLRALKVWMSLLQHGKRGHAAFIRRDLELTEAFFGAVSKSPMLEPHTRNLCVATFRFLPKPLRDTRAEAATRELLNALNQEILDRIQSGGDTYLSNAVVAGTYLLRACFVNHRTRYSDIAHVIDLVERTGSEVYAAMAQRKAI